MRSKQSEGVEGLKTWLGLAVSHVSEVCATHSLVKGSSMGLFSLHNSGFLNESYKVNPIGQWRKILVTQMGFACIFGHRLLMEQDLLLIWPKSEWRGGGTVWGFTRTQDVAVK